MLLFPTPVPIMQRSGVFSHNFPDWEVKKTVFKLLRACLTLQTPSVYQQLLNSAWLARSRRLAGTFFLKKQSVRKVNSWLSEICLWSMDLILDISQKKERLKWWRAIFQTFWWANSCTDSWSLKLDIGCFLIFWFPLNVQSFSKIGQH